MRRTSRAVLLALALAACGSGTEPASAPTPTSTEQLPPSTAPLATTAVLAIASATAVPSSSPAVTPVPETARPTPTPTLAPAPTASPTPAQTRVPNSDALPTPHGLPANDGCLYYGAQPPYITFVDCVVHGLPPGAPVTLTANGDVVFLRIGSTVVFPDGSWYFPWSETQHKEIVFIVTAGGLRRTLTQVFK